VDEEKLGRYLRLVRKQAQIYSKDPSIQVFAHLMDREGSPLSDGYNGLPRGCDDSDSVRVSQRPSKYFWAEHGERNALYNRARPMLEGSLVISSAFPNMNDARAVVAVGGASLVCPTASHASPENVANVRRLFSEVGVELVIIDEGTRSVDWRNDKILDLLEDVEATAQELSKDPWAPAATFFVAKNGYRKISEGFSGMPRGCNDTDLTRAQPGEYEYWYEQATRNAIYNCLRRELKGAISVQTHCPCMDCARGFVQVGLSLVATGTDRDYEARWSEHVRRAEQLFNETGVELLRLPESVI